jgi:protein-disulfide isomerase
MTTRTDIAAPSRIPRGAAANGDGVTEGSAGAIVDLYIDFLCPFCRMFEEQHGAAIDQAVDRGRITAVYHAVGFLDRLSTTRYSTRAAAAGGCAADAGRFREYRHTLYDNQPPENSDGLSDEELAALATQAGLDEGFARCIRGGAYLEWSEYVTALALARGVNGIPSVFVEGAGVPANARAILAAAGARA